MALQIQRPTRIHPLGGLGGRPRGESCRDIAGIGAGTGILGCRGQNGSLKPSATIPNRMRAPRIRPPSSFTSYNFLISAAQRFRASLALGLAIGEPFEFAGAGCFWPANPGSYSSKIRSSESNALPEGKGNKNGVAPLIACRRWHPRDCSRIQRRVSIRLLVVFRNPPLTSARFLG